ncbi:MAG: hypothetical protein JWP12_3887 [Bacteroidetes bacterium]|nr:hypothetical protein [Bacteroidota bacterium]
MKKTMTLVACALFAFSLVGVAQTDTKTAKKDDSKKEAPAKKDDSKKEAKKDDSKKADSKKPAKKEEAKPADKK